MVYLADSSALAILEVFVNIASADVPEPYQLLRVEAPDDLGMADFPDTQPPSLDGSRRWGDAWLRAAATPLARVPSMVAPFSHNLLLNPAHPDASKAVVTEASRWPWDRRLFR